MKDKTDLEFLRVSPFWEDELKAVWLEFHPKDLEPKETSEIFDVYHQTGWRAEYT